MMTRFPLKVFLPTAFLLTLGSAFLPPQLSDHRTCSFVQSNRLSAKFSTTDRKLEENDTTAFFPWMQAPTKESPMADQRRFLKVDRKPPEETGENMKLSLDSSAIFLGLGAVVFAVLAGNFSSLSSVVDLISNALKDPSATLDAVIQSVDSMGPLGAVYFGAAYTVAEILAIPAVPLTASAGYLFGPALGTLVVLISASIAASFSFLIGRTLLRDFVEEKLEDYPEFAKVDRVIGKEGFKLMLLLRLSPIFPFALSNYLYGASSINFNGFFWGTLLGFAPGTLAYVYTGYIGKTLTTDGSDAYPWYVYAGGLALFAGVLKLLADTATRLVDELDE